MPEGHTWAYAQSTTDVNKHVKYCDVCSSASDSRATSEGHTWENGKCKFCDAANPNDKYTITIAGSSTVRKGASISLSATVKNDGVQVSSPSLKWTSKNPSIATVDANTGEVTGVAVGTATIEVTYTDTAANISKTATKSIEVTNPFWIDSDPSHATLYSMSDELVLTAYINENTKVDNVKWSLTGNNSSYFSIDDYSNGKCVVTPDSTSASKISGTITATAIIDDVKHEASKTVYLNISTDISLSATVSSDYYFEEVGEANSDKYSVEEQLDNYISDKLSSKNDKRYLDEVWFTSKTDTSYGYLSVDKDDEIDAEDFGDVLFTPKAKGKATFDFSFTTVNENGRDRTRHTGTLTITVTDASDSSGDVVFYGDVGEDVSLDSGSFEDFWDDKYPNGELDYVTFSVSGGTLRDADGKTVGSKKCYVRAGRNEIELDEVYFEPNSTNKKNAKTVTFSFTAYGENKSGSSKEASGRVSIVYTAENPDDITYTSGSNGTVSLKASDFTAAYKEVISGSVPSNLTIVFQSVPRNGTLTYNDSSKKNAKDVKLTSSNIKKYSFTTKSSGSNQLNDVVYSGTSGTDTIDYIAYSGSTIKFKGSVVFNGKGAIPQDVVVYYASTAGQPARFSQNDFTTANSAMSKAAKIRFVTPANGTLYLNGSTSAAGIDIAPALLYSVTYQPKAGFNGTDKVVFAAYDASNNLVANGSVNITVAGNPTTSTTPGGTTNPGGVTDVSQFTDVSGNAWYRANLATLVSKGVISGRGDGKFDPKGTVTYGEALKMVLESCGYTAAVGTGSQWAINYKNLAVSKGWISSSVDLNAAISRNATAELAAKVLGVAPVTSGSPFGDEANAYAVALYYTTPQIFVGTTNPNGGKPLFENSKPLLREQVCAVICRVSDYHTQHTTNVMPDGV